ncbi:MarR family transcriptional regulator [Leucobacter allii]|uniref:MarR family transcriptional regulator n=1 Tax=Leucobacter allii TaxID=2932247 RepID=A0ABY4FN18_9MICO|nr:MarR family transcriptional regulator [Leucobacter allii]UOQ57630.1 MarR family transcriptional regulator [Leucobacter allii]
MDEQRRRIDVRLANEAWESLMSAHASLMQVFAAEQMWEEISMREYDVLYTLAKHGAPVRMSEVQSGVLLSQPALSRMIDRLAQRGLVAREPDPVDGRAVRLSLTEEGARIQREVGRAHAKSVARQLDAALTPEEMRQLRHLASRLAAR